MPLKLRYDTKLSKLKEVSGAWIDDADGIIREAERRFRYQYPTEKEIAILRDAVLSGVKVPDDYIAALANRDKEIVEKTKEAAAQNLLWDKDARKAATADSLREAMTSAGMTPSKVATKESLIAVIEAAAPAVDVGR